MRRRIGLSAILAPAAAPTVDGVALPVRSPRSGWIVGIEAAGRNRQRREP